MTARVGNLVYIPSSTNLMKYESTYPVKVHCLASPASVLIMEEKENQFGVLFEGEVWYVDKKKVYNA